MTRPESGPPGEVGSVQLLQVAGGSGVQHVDQAAIGLPGVHIVDELVQVLIPQVGVLILEVRAHGHDDVIGLIDLSLRIKQTKTQKVLFGRIRLLKNI